MSEPTFQKVRYQLNIMINSEDDCVSEYLFNYYSKKQLNFHSGDSGIDLISPFDINSSSGEICSINHYIKCEMIDLETNEFTSYYLYTRSSISNTPLIMSNSVGIIDAGYRGFIMSKFRNFSSKDFNISKGDRLVQICAPDLKPIRVNIVTKLNKSTRGEGGFGSTGK